MQLEPYIYFHGTCEEALTFYARCLDGRIAALNRITGSPVEGETPPEYHDKVMHAAFEADGVRFMASDGRPGTPPHGEDDIALSLAMEDPDRAKCIFEALAEGGEVTMPFQDAFWGGKFGSLTDRFGIQWMLSAGSPS